MTAVACRVPAKTPNICLWEALHPVVGRKGGDCLHVDDSKKVYASGKGIAALERTALATLACHLQDAVETLRQLLDGLSGDDAGIDEPWFHGDTRLPREACPIDLRNIGGELRSALERAGVQWGPIVSVAVDAPRFNQIVDRYDSKGAVLATAFVTLARACLDADGDATIVVDKHGGRNFYGPLLQEISPDCWVTPIKEGARESTYEIRWPGDSSGRRARVTFRPEADGTSFEVAVASIVSKYLRELFMEEFNAYWKSHLPDIAPTAGYPGDAARFLGEIEHLLPKLKLERDRIWRKR
jgi:hypothetical protein